MAISIEMPRLSDTMEEGTLVKWRVKVGDTVASGDHLADVETDKATMELQTFDDGTVAAVNVQEGQTVPVGKVILVLAEEGEDVKDAAAAAKAPSDKAKSSDAKKSAPGEVAAAAGPSDQSTKSESALAHTSDDTTTGGSEDSGGAKRLKVSPVARAIADDKGIDLHQLKGTGPGGRIIKRDVLDATLGSSASKPPGGVASATTPTAPGTPASLEAKSIPLSGMRKTIAKRLVESTTTVPHFTVAVPIDADPLLALRKTLNDQLESQGVKLSVNDFVTRAVAVAAVQHPLVNSSWADDTIQQHGSVHVGIAVALPAERGGGLVVPVLRDVQNMGLRQISADTKRLAKKARDTGLTTDEMSGGTLTISNLGMFGVSHFTAIINPPQAAILAIGAALEKPVVRDGQLTVGHEMTITMSGDHRVLDGAVAAEYLATLKNLLEHPAALLV